MMDKKTGTGIKFDLTHVSLEFLESVFDVVQILKDHLPSFGFPFVASIVEKNIIHLPTLLSVYKKIRKTLEGSPQILEEKEFLALYIYLDLGLKMLLQPMGEKILSKWMEVTHNNEEEIFAFKMKLLRNGQEFIFFTNEALKDHDSLINLQDQLREIEITS